MSAPFESFADAKTHADSVGGMVCGTYKGKQPIYIVLPAGTPDDAIEVAAFAARHGRPPSDTERQLKTILDRRLGTPA